MKTIRYNMRLCISFLMASLNISLALSTEKDNFDWLFTHSARDMGIYAPGISDPGMSDSTAALQQARLRSKILLTLMHGSFIGDLTTINLGNAYSGNTGTETDVEIIYTSKFISRFPDSSQVVFTHENFSPNQEALVLGQLLKTQSDSLFSERISVTITRFVSLRPRSTNWSDHSDMININATNDSGILLYNYSVDLKGKEVVSDMEDHAFAIKRRLVFGQCQYENTKGRSVFGHAGTKPFSFKCKAHTGNGLWSAMMESVTQGICVASGLMESKQNLLVSTGIENTDQGYNVSSQTEYLQSAKNFALNEIIFGIGQLELKDGMLSSTVSIGQVHGKALPRAPSSGFLPVEAEDYFEKLEKERWQGYAGEELESVTGAIWEHLQNSDQYISANNSAVAANINTALLMSLEMSKLKLANNFNASRYMLTSTNAHTEEVSTVKSAKSVTQADLEGIYPYYFIQRPLGNGYFEVQSFVFLKVDKIRAE
jgi:hypothetical protein